MTTNTPDTSRRFTVTRTSDLEIVMTRVFDAPRPLVFEAYTKPEHIERWWGPRRLTTTVEQQDLRPGGRWRFVQHDAEGNEYAFNGVYREVVPPERIVTTFEFEGAAGHILIDTATFEERDDRTILTITSLFASVEDLEGMVQAGMADGAAEGFDRLEELLQTLA